MKLALREDTTAQIIDVIGTVNKHTNPTGTAGTIGAGAAKGAALGATLGTIFPGVGTAIGAGVGAAIGGGYAGIQQQNTLTNAQGVQQIIQSVAQTIGKPLIQLTDTELIAWGMAYNAERKDIPAKIAAGVLSNRVGKRYQEAYNTVVNEIKAEANRRGYAKGKGIPVGRNPNVDTGETPTTGKAPNATATVENGVITSSMFGNIGSIATIGLIGALAYMLFKKK